MQEVFAPSQSITVDAVTYALDERDRERRRANQTERELIAMFDHMGFAMKRLGLLPNSAFWQQNGPVDPGTVLMPT